MSGRRRLLPRGPRHSKAIAFSFSLAASARAAWWRTARGLACAGPRSPGAGCGPRFAVASCGLNACGREAWAGASRAIAGAAVVGVRLPAGQRAHRLRFSPLPECGRLTAAGARLRGGEAWGRHACWAARRRCWHGPVALAMDAGACGCLRHGFRRGLQGWSVPLCRLQLWPELRFVREIARFRGGCNGRFAAIIPRQKLRITWRQRLAVASVAALAERGDHARCSLLCRSRRSA